VSQIPPPPGPGPQPTPGGWQPQPQPQAQTPAAPGGTSYAEWWKRAVALILDGLILGIPATIVAAALSIGTFSSVQVTTDATGNVTNIEGGAGFIGGFLAMSLLFFIVGIGYYVYFHGSDRGQTLGKMVMKIAVKDEATGGSIGYGRATVRWLVATVLWNLCFLPGLIDHLFPLWDDRRQSLHDKAARSVVIDVP